MSTATPRLHIFRAGRHTDVHGRTYEFSEADVAAIAAAYDPAKAEAPLVIGHPALDAPAYGWVASLAASGADLEAEPRQVAPEFAALVREQRYRHISASFFPPGHPSNPVPGVWYLRHVGFLGAANPAVKGLRPAELAGDEEGVVEFASPWETRQQLGLWRRLREWLIGREGAEVADQVVPGELLQALTEDNAEELVADRVESLPQPAPFAAPAPHTEEPMKLNFAATPLGATLARLITATGHPEAATLTGMAGAAGLSESAARQVLAGTQAATREQLTAFADHLGAEPALLLAAADPVGFAAELEASITARQAELEQREQRLAEAERERRRGELAAFAEAQVAAGRLLPRERDGVIALLEALPADAAPAAAFAAPAEGDAEPQPATAEQFARRLIESLPARVDYAERAAGGGEPGDQALSDEQVSDRARSYVERERAKGRRVSFADGVAAVHAGRDQAAA